MSNENERSNEAVASEATSDTQPVRVTLPPGHFYSPIVDPSQINPQRVWPAQPDIIGIDFNDANHERLLKEVFPKYLREYDFPEHLDQKGDLTDFFYSELPVQLARFPFVFCIPSRMAVQATR